MLVSLKCVCGTCDKIWDSVIIINFMLNPTNDKSKGSYISDLQLFYFASHISIIGYISNIFKYTWKDMKMKLKVFLYLYMCVFFVFRLWYSYIIIHGYDGMVLVVWINMVMMIVMKYIIVSFIGRFRFFWASIFRGNSCQIS